MAPVRESGASGGPAHEAGPYTVGCPLHPGHLRDAEHQRDPDRERERSGLTETTLMRRFKQATGYSPLRYVQLLRVEEAKRLLEKTDTPIDEISWTVGYENPAFFRRLFKRCTRLTPSEYRRKFRIPDFARVA